MAGKGGTGGIIACLAQNKTVFGSDVYLAYTFNYVWKANQFGHLLIGLFPGLILGWLLGWPYAFIVIAVYILKEVVDYLIVTQLVENVFQPNIGEPLLDGVVDVAFVAWGVFVAAAVLSGLHWGWKLAAFAGSVAFYLLMARVYLPGKTSFDRSGLPKFVRLPTFPESFEFGVPKGAPDYDKAKRAFADRVRRFAKGEDACPIRHLVVAGPRSSGRSTFALAVGGEAASGPDRRKDFKVRYVTATQLHEIASDRFEVPSEERPWCVAEADLIVVDEIDPIMLPLDEKNSDAEVEASLRRLVDVQKGKFKGLSVFQRPFGMLNPEWTENNGKEKWIFSSNEARKELPRIIWVAGRHDHNRPEAHKEGARLAAAVVKRFGIPPACMELVKLEGLVFERRTKTRARAKDQEASGLPGDPTTLP